MSRPGYDITQTDTNTGRGSSSPTGTWFVVGLTEKGPTVPTAVYSNGQFKRVFGGLVSYSVLPDSVEDHFSKGGSKVIVQRLVGSGAKAATKTIASLKVEAASVGEWGNGLKVAIDAEGEASYVVIVTNTAGELLARSPALTSLAAAPVWAAGTDYVRITVGGEVFPVDAAAAALTGGEDKRTSVADADWQAALAEFDADLGPGQVSTPGRGTSQGYADIAVHCATHNRRGYLDVAVTDDTAAELRAAAATARAAAGVNAEYVSIWGPWSIIPGAVPNTSRKVPASGAEASNAARTDAATGNPNVPAAGELGVSKGTLGLVAEKFSDEQRTELNDAGLNLIRNRNGVIKTYGFRTLADKIAYPNGWQLANSRLSMAIQADCEAVAETHLFRQIDGNEIELGRFRGDLEAVLEGYYNKGALFGATKADAFLVNVGPDVNSTTSLADGTLAAVLKVRRSPFSEFVPIEIAVVHPTATV